MNKPVAPVDKTIILQNKNDINSDDSLPTILSRRFSSGDSLRTILFLRFSSDDSLPTILFRRFYSDDSLLTILFGRLGVNRVRSIDIQKIFSRIIVTTSAVSSTTLGSILIFASCVLLYRSPVFSKFRY